MNTTEFHYRKLYYYGKVAVALIFAGFLAYFILLSYEGFLTDPITQEFRLDFLAYFYITIISLITVILLYILIKAAKVAFSSGPALAMDAEKLVINGKREFLWEDIDYIKYVKGRVTSSSGRGVQGRSVYYLHVKPEHGRKVKVDITQIDEQHGEIFDALREYAPKLDIKGWKH